MSSNPDQLLLVDGSVPVADNAVQPIAAGMKYRPATHCEGPGCGNIVPAGFVFRTWKHTFCCDRCNKLFQRHQTAAHKASGTVRKLTRSVFREVGPCEAPGCGKLVPAGYVFRADQHYFCNWKCERRFHRINRNERIKQNRPVKTHRAPTRRYFREAGPCEGPGCNNVVPAGYVLAQQKHRLCGKRCMWRYQNHRYVVGECLKCGGPIYGPPSDIGRRKFCGNEHYWEFQKEHLLGPTGPFQSLIEEHLRTTDRYSESTLPNVKSGVCRFFRFAVSEGITDLSQIKSSTIKRFIASDRSSGINNGNAIGYLSSLFKDQMADEVMDRNPVISGIHKQNPGISRFPYTEREMAILWDLVLKSGNMVLIVAFAIAEESGIRNSEICQILIDDIDLDAQTIFVRKPAKGGDQRKVPFREKSKQYIQAWLKERDPACGHNYLLHHSQLGRFHTSLLDYWFKKELGGQPEPAASFILHRLRHSWACRLINSGMQLSVLQALGGWKSLRSVQWYAKLRPETIQRAYEAAYRTMEQKRESPDEEVFSMADFLGMEDDDATNQAAAAA